MFPTVSLYFLLKKYFKEEIKRPDNLFLNREQKYSTDENVKGRKVGREVDGALERNKRLIRRSMIK